jgi:hypothetical protein
MLAVRQREQLTVEIKDLPIDARVTTNATELEEFGKQAVLANMRFYERFLHLFPTPPVPFPISYLRIEPSETNNGTFIPRMNKRTSEIVLAVQIPKSAARYDRLSSTLTGEMLAKKTRYEWKKTVIHETAHIFHNLYFNLCLPKEYVCQTANDWDGRSSIRQRTIWRWNEAEKVLTSPDFKGLHDYYSHDEWKDRGSYELVYRFVWDFVRNADGEESPDKLFRLFELVKDFTAPAEAHILAFAEQKIRAGQSLDNKLFNDYERLLISRGLTKDRFLEMLPKYADKEFYETHRQWIIR